MCSMRTCSSAVFYARNWKRWVCVLRLLRSRLVLRLSMQAPCTQVLMHWEFLGIIRVTGSWPRSTR